MLNCFSKKRKERYFITKTVLGSGASSTVLLAKDNKTGENLACKLISKKKYSINISFKPD